jgi:hypothetical protein
MTVKWLDQPQAHDFDAAADYLSLVGEPDAVEKTVTALRSAEQTFRKAKDILRAAGLALLSTSNPRDARLQIADGYHRVCASYVTDENTSIPCRLVSWQT